MATNTTDQAKEAIQEGADALDETVQAASRKTSRAISRTRDSAENAINQGQDIMEDAIACTKEIIRENPITAVLAVAAVAYLIGRLRS
jgi:ElaB/YqjD/DUF883 family membrane-anchored ribosome-binding protein